MRGEVSKREAIVMWRGLYHDHWLLGAHKDTMPRRKWLKLIGTTIAASALACPSSGQQPSLGKQFPFIIDEAGAPESWEGSHPLSPFSSLNLSTGNLFTSIPIVSLWSRSLHLFDPLPQQRFIFFPSTFRLRLDAFLQLENPTRQSNR